MKHENLIKLRFEMMIQSYHELMIEISQKYMQKQTFWMNKIDEDNDWQKNEKNEMMNLQTKHMMHIVEMIYA